MRLFTVATSSYLHQAELMIKSFRSHHPDFKASVIVPDINETSRDELQRIIGSEVEVLCTADLGDFQLDNMRKYYKPLEFCSAMKILGFHYFLGKNETSVFIDPDVLILDTLFHGLFDLQGDVLLSPHTLGRYPDDSKAPTDLEIIRSGHINGGVILTRNSEGGREVINWLISKIQWEWFVSPKTGLYADQLWISSLPYFFRNNIALIEDKGINVAYWNLHERKIVKEENNKLVMDTGSPVKLLHLSGFDCGGHSLSKHTSRSFGLSTELALSNTLENYRRDMAIGQGRYSEIVSDFRFASAPLYIRIKRAKLQKIWFDKDVLFLGSKSCS